MSVLRVRCGPGARKMLMNSGILPVAVLWLLWAVSPYAHSDLSDHPSPYLQRHADDPIRWQSPESIHTGRTRNDNLPFLVSSGYLSCYWCYRFTQDTLQDFDLAREINESYLPILLDREVHAEDDRRLQAFLKKHVGVGGWPAIAVVTPAGVPVLAWTYVAAPKLHMALKTFSDAWKNDPETTQQLLAANKANRPGHEVSSIDAAEAKPKLRHLLESFLSQTAEVSDLQFGGFGTDAKYPFVPQLLALLDLHQINPGDAMAGFLRHSLDSMSSADLIDPIAGGVFRYTENRDWTEPHFEQMLYTQALVARLYFRAAMAFGQPKYAGYAQGILENMLDHFSGEEGWFVASLSAIGSQGRNGAYYLVTERELSDLLGAVWRTQVEVRQQVGDRLLVVPTGTLSEITRQLLLAHRRTKDLERDEKKLLSWNGLALSALSHGAASQPKFRSAATRLAAAIMAETEALSPGLLVGADGPELPADLDGMVFAAAGLFDWWQVSGDSEVIDRVRQLLEQAIHHFHQGSGWHRASAYVLAGSSHSRYIPDDQLPSPTAEWFRLTVGLQAAGIVPDPGTSEVAAQMAAGWPATLAQSAFFHPTQISALVLGRFLGIY